MLRSKDISMSSTVWRNDGQRWLLQWELQQPAEWNQRWGHGGDRRSHAGLFQHRWRASSGPGLWLRWVPDLPKPMCCIYSQMRQRGLKMAPVTIIMWWGDNICHPVLSLFIEIPIVFFPLSLTTWYRFGGKCVTYRSLVFVCLWENSGENSLRSQLRYLPPPLTEILLSMRSKCTL